jgi:uncharacterized protein YyaL (SSP411 family)
MREILRKISIVLSVTLLVLNINASEVKWGKLTPKTFEQAKKENKIILLNLEANWCHWCHVMHDSTYANKEVAQYIEKHFIPVSADQDANPELSIRYQDYGWPATIFINAAGEDVVKRAGYMRPQVFLKLLKAIVADPSPEEANTNLSKVAGSKNLNNATIENLDKIFLKVLDYKVGGFNQSQKYVAWDTYEYAMFGNSTDEVKNWIDKSVIGAKKLSDPAWGGVYQYSTHGDWEHLHFEKLLSIQARYAQIFLLHHLYFNNGESLQFAKNTFAYTERFLALPNGLYANAQDADLIKGEHAGAYFLLSDKERMKLGVPHIDKNTYTQRNGELAVAFLKMYYATEDQNYKLKSEKILQELFKRKNKIGLYYHDTTSRQIWSLKDQVAVAEALIESIKSDNKNLLYARELKLLVTALKNNYMLSNGSAKSFVGENGLSPEPILDENIKLARIFNWYANYKNETSFKDIAQSMLAFLTNPAVSDTYYNEPAILMLNNEINTPSFQYVFLDNNGVDFSLRAKAMAPFNSQFGNYKPNELPEEKKDIFAGFTENVLFICTDAYCSSPIYDKEGVDAFFIK